MFQTKIIPAKLQTFVRILFYSSIGICLLVLIDDWINGRYSDMDNHLRWALWIGIASILMTTLEIRTGGEGHKDISDEHVESEGGEA
jgi:hypothetical protein